MKTLAHPPEAAEIGERILRLTPDDTGRWGSLTVHEVICHVRDAYEGAMGQRGVKAAARRPLIPQPVYKWLALNFPREWPKGVETVPEVNPRKGGSRPVEFASDVDALLRRHVEFCAFTGPFPPHPIFGAMTHREWKRWGYLHSDHHLRQFGR